MFFSEKTEFFRELKQRAIKDSDYENYFYLYKTLKMKSLGDMNDLYNAQDIVLLAEIIENRFQFIHERYGFNPRRCNSASTLSSCIEHEMDRVILALPTKLEHVEIFEQKITGGFSSVNTRLALDNHILSLNLDKPNQNTDDNPSNKDYDYKVVYNLKLDDKKSEKKSVKSLSSMKITNTVME